MRTRSLLLLLALVLTPLAGAQALLHEIGSPVASDGDFGRYVSDVPDADGDGIPDVLVGSPGEDAQRGRARLFSGASGALLHTLASPNEEQLGNFGTEVSGVEDVDGDGRGDLLVGAYTEDPPGSPESAGRAYVFSGATGALLHELASPNEEDFGQFGYDVAGVPDANGDGRGDVLVGTSNEGRACLFSGANGALLRQLHVPGEPGFGSLVAGVPDVDGDGRGDLLVGGGGGARLFSGASGALLHNIVRPNPDDDLFGSISISGVPDLDGDDRGDLLIAANFGPFTNSPAGAYVFSGATGTLLHTIEDPHTQAGKSNYFKVSGMPDVNRDGAGDLLLSDYSAHVRAPGPVRNAGQVYLFSGATGRLIYEVTSPNAQEGGRFGIAVSGIADVDGDRRGDLLVGADGEFDEGRAYVISGRKSMARAAGAAPAQASASGSVPEVFALAAHPNPFAVQTRLAFELPAASAVRLSVFDGLGREVAVLVDDALGAGQHEAVLDGTQLPAGTYLVRLEAGGRLARQRITLVR